MRIFFGVIIGLILAIAGLATLGLLGNGVRRYGNQ